MVDSRLYVAVRFYNSCLSEAIARLREVHADPTFASRQRNALSAQFVHEFRWQISVPAVNQHWVVGITLS